MPEPILNSIHTFKPTRATQKIQTRQYPSTLTLHASTHIFTANSPFRNLYVIFEQILSFYDHTTELILPAFHISDLRIIRPMLGLRPASTIATSILHAKLDYCNSCFQEHRHQPKINRPKLFSMPSPVLLLKPATPPHHYVLKTLHWPKLAHLSE